MKQTQESISERARGLLKALIERYIEDGQPVGSKVLASTTPYSLSPATIRNVMADLEAAGLVTSPHTSAGRIPTPLGLRFFVDSLITVQPLPRRKLASLQEQLDPNQAPQQLVSSVSDLLCGLTDMVSVVTVPRKASLTLRQVEFLPLSGQRVLVILVLNSRDVENRILQAQRDYSAEELVAAANYINQHCAGRRLEEIRGVLLEEMHADKQHLDQMMAAVLELAAGAFGQDQPQSDCVVSGTGNLIDCAATEDMQQLRSLFDAFQQKRDILYLLDQCIDSDGVKLYIGEESGYQVLDSLSVVTAPYVVGGEAVGVLGVIGPTRMRYQKVIPLVDATSQLLSMALNQ